MKKKYETKIKDYTKDVEQNINQEAVVQTIKNAKKTLCRQKIIHFLIWNFYMIRCILYRNDGGSCKGVC